MLLFKLPSLVTEPYFRRSERYSIRYSFRARGLEPLTSVKGDLHSSIRTQFDGAALADILGDRLTLEEIDSMGSAQRLEWIGRIGHHLAHSNKVTVTM